MSEDSIRAASLQASQRAKALGLTQEQISNELGISQSQVSRILSGQSKRRSRVFDEICNYVNKYETGISVDNVRQNEELLEALASIWDGTPCHALALATVIRTLGVLGDHSSHKNAAKTIKRN